MSDFLHEMQAWQDRMAAEARALARQARERGAHDVAEHYESDALRLRAAAERSRLVWGPA